MQIIGKLRLVYNKYANTNKCINFKSKEQEDDLISQFEGVALDSNIFMQDGDTILVPLNYEECIKYNYCYFNNKINDVEKKRYFCYITNYQYVEPSVTRISVAVDTLQTFLFDIDKFRGNIERCHSARRINVSNTETPRYIINPDLYFMEDEVDVYKAVETHKGIDNTIGGNTLVPHSPYIVLTFALKDATTSGKHTEKIEAASSIFNATDAVIEFEQTGTGYAIEDESGTLIGKTRPLFGTYGLGESALYSLCIRTQVINEYELDDGLPPTICYDDFKYLFPEAFDNLIDAFYISKPSPDMAYVEDGVYVKTTAGVTAPVGSYYQIKKSSDTFKRVLLNIDDNNNLSPSKWVNRTNDTSLVRLIDQEKKLDLYPYSYVNIVTLGGEMVWKYQENYKFLLSGLGLENNVYSFVSWFDPINPNPVLNYSLLTDYSHLVSLSNADTIKLFDVNTQNKEIKKYFIGYNTGEPLPSIAVFQDRFVQYMNYEKAMVDANNVMAGINTTVGSLFSTGKYNIEQGVMQQQLDTYLTPKTKKKGKRYERALASMKGDMSLSTLGFGSSIVSGVLDTASSYAKTIINEQMLKKQPLKQVNQGSTATMSFTCLTDANGALYDYTITKYECIDNIKSIYEQKFYNYGYHIPVDVELTKVEFFDIINNRKYFCYMEWNSLELESFIPTIYVNDIIARLTSGVRFENTSDDTLFPTYTINSNNKETSIPAKPFFVRNY